jgi:enoyl-CoA hydratase/carnithine racemase
MNYETILYEEDNKIGILTLNRPHTVNAINLKMIEELEQIFDQLNESETARVLILTGAGEKGFCSGMDMQEAAIPLFAQSPDIIYKYQLRTSQLYRKMRCIPQPIIAAIHGAASGGGFSFAMASDVRIITPEARFSASYINIGLGGADLASSYFLPKLIGSGRANEFLLTGEFMTAEDAMQLGFASRMVPKENVLHTAIELAKIMVDKNPFGLRLTKEAINQNLGVSSLEQALHLENRNQVLLIAGLKLEQAKQKAFKDEN